MGSDQSASGTDRHDYAEAKERGYEWLDRAEENVDEWGDQSVETLLLAAQEELGELTQAVLEYRSEDGYYGPIYEELDDLGPLLFQLFWAINRHDVDTGTAQEEKDG